MSRMEARPSLATNSTSDSSGAQNITHLKEDDVIYVSMTRKNEGHRSQNDNPNLKMTKVHPGNSSFQRVINLNKGSFKNASDKSEKLRIAKAIVASIREGGGRFLERQHHAHDNRHGRCNSELGNELDNSVVWRDVGYRKSMEMTIRALKDDVQVLNHPDVYVPVATTRTPKNPNKPAGEPREVAVNTVDCGSNIETKQTIKNEEIWTKTESHENCVNCDATKKSKSCGTLSFEECKQMLLERKRAREKKLELCPTNIENSSSKSEIDTQSKRLKLDLSANGESAGAFLGKDCRTLGGGSGADKTVKEERNHVKLACPNLKGSHGFLKKEEEETDDEDEIEFLGVVPPKNSSEKMHSNNSINETASEAVDTTENAASRSAVSNTPDPTTSAARATLPTSSLNSKQAKESLPNNLLKLNPQQTSKLKYPVGCPVWYNICSHPKTTEEEESTDGTASSTSLKSDSNPNVAFASAGIVESASLDVGMRCIFYGLSPVSHLPCREETSKVKTKDTDQRSNTLECKTLVFVKEDNLVFAPHCPVHVRLKSVNDKDFSTQAGEVMSYQFSESRVNESGMVKKGYKVMLSSGNQSQILEGVDEDCIEYRNEGSFGDDGTSRVSEHNVDNSIDFKTESESLRSFVGKNDPDSGDQSVTSCYSMDTEANEETFHALCGERKTIQCPSSIPTLGGKRAQKNYTQTYTVNGNKSVEDFGQCGDLGVKGQLSCHSTSTNNEKTSPGLEGMHPSGMGFTQKNFLNENSFNTMKEQNKGKVLRIDIPSWLQQNKSLRSELFFFLIGNDECGKKMGHKTKEIARKTRCSVHIRNEQFSGEMYIMVKTKSNNQAENRLKRAREIIFEALFQIVKDDGSKGKFCYDFASLFPENASSCGSAFHHWNPFTDSQNWISTLPLPYIKESSADNGGKPRYTFHGDYLLKNTANRVWSDFSCRIKVCGVSIRNQTNFCDPYVFIHGRSRKDVNCAIEIVKEAIVLHQATCSCVLSDDL